MTTLLPGETTTLTQADINRMYEEMNLERFGEQYRQWLEYLTQPGWQKPSATWHYITSADRNSFTEVGQYGQLERDPDRIAGGG